MYIAANETNKSHLQAAVLYVSTYRLESMQTLASVAKMILQMCLIWKNSTKRILTSVLSRKEWTHKRWNGMAQLIQMKRYLVLTYLAGWKHFTPLPTCQILAVSEVDHST